MDSSREYGLTRAEVALPEVQRLRKELISSMRTTSTAAQLTEIFETSDAFDDTVLEIVVAVLKYTNPIVAQWREMGVPEGDIHRCIDAASSLYRCRCQA